MSRSLWLAPLLALAACPKSPTGTGVAPPQAGAACPAGNGVLIASYVAQDPAKGRSGWVMPLSSRAIRDNERLREYASFPADEAAQAGVSAAPTGNLWLATSNGPPCQTRIGSYYAAVLEGSVSYGVELEGCPAPASADEGGGIVLVAATAPTGCRFEAPQPVASRLGQMTAQKQWQAPVNETPIPAALASVIPARECAAPGCEKLWAFGEVQVDGRPVAWSGAVNWLTVGDPAQACQWPVERFSGFFIPGGPGEGAATQVREGQTHPLVLSAVLADASGPRVLLAEGPGEYVTYDLGAGKATLARAVTWMQAPAAAWEAIDHIGPICEPETGAAGAP